MATDLGKAYVQVLPSAQGIKGKLSEIINPESKKAGQSAGLNIAGLIKKALITGGIATALKSAISEGANLQQAIGGIETLYKGSADTMKKYSDEAFQTTGLSATKYMETVTGFSASLLQGLGGDTAKAAEISNMAMIDMADNSNKFGTSMESIQVAYQGFAKQNYTMLDNLKLGYGGTKSEMERLLADAQKISGVKYDIKNLSDVYSAIHVIQEELDITGTTSKEASTTLTGSLNAMKASFQNVLGKLALGQDIQPALNSVVQTTFTFLSKNLIPMIWNIVKSLPTTLSTLMKSLSQLIMTEGVSFINNFANGFQSGLPNIQSKLLELIWKMQEFIKTQLPIFLSNGVEIITNIANGIMQNLPQIITAVFQIATEILRGLLDALPQIYEAGIQLIQNLSEGLIQSAPAIISAIGQGLGQMLLAIAERLPMIFQKGIELIGQLVAGLISAIPTILGAIPGIFNQVVGEFGRQDWAKIGSDIINGLVNGLKNGISKVVEAATNVAKAAFEGAKNFLGIKSPSRKAMWLMKMFGEGWLAQAKKSGSDIKDSMKSLFDFAVNDVESQIAVSTIYRPSSIQAANFGNAGGYNQTVNIYSPKALTPSEVARQTRNATRQMALHLSIG